MKAIFRALPVLALTAGISVAVPTDAFACRTTIGDFVWLDSNGNGIQDAGEPGINGVTVKITADHLTPGGRTFVTANKPGTSDPGYYSFVVECDTDYVVSIDAATVPAEYAKSPIGVGGNEAVDSNDHDGTLVNIANPMTGNHPEPNLTFDFGYVPACEGKIGDFVWSDLNNNGIQDAGEPAIAGAVVTLNGSSPIASSSSGAYLYSGLCAGTYNVCVQVPPGSQPSPADQGGNDAVDSNGQSNGHGGSCATVTLPAPNTVNLTIDFGFFYPPVTQVGTGTPGYWKNHPEAWPVSVISIGGVSYTKAQALSVLDQSDGDKTITLFRSLVAATLNVLSGSDQSCIASTIVSANSWMATYGPAGSKVKASSLAWKLGEPLYRTLDNYNNGMLCAPSRDSLE
jgi:hypothetical protein